MKLKNLYLVLFMFCMSTAIFAQDKYEQAVVVQNGLQIVVSIEGKETQIEKISSKGLAALDFLPIINKIAQLRNEGWEVWNSSTAGGIHYFLRKKLK